jgi:hypothetical protein
MYTLTAISPTKARFIIENGRSNVAAAWETFRFSSISSTAQKDSLVQLIALNEAAPFLMKPGAVRMRHRCEPHPHYTFAAIEAQALGMDFRLGTKAHWNPKRRLYKGSFGKAKTVKMRFKLPDQYQ